MAQLLQPLLFIWNLLLFQPFVNVLIYLYNLFGHNLGWAIIALTGALRIILVPLTSTSLKSAQKMQGLAPELEKLKAQHKDDKQALAQAQLALYKQHGINPAAGCLPQLVQIVILIALFNAFNLILRTSGDSLSKLNQVLYQSQKFAAGSSINTSFLYFDLAKPDVLRLPSLPIPIPGILVILSAITQFISAKMMMPAAKKARLAAEKTPEGGDDMAAAMQTQMLYMFPLMTLVIGISFPSGLALYWFVFSLFSMIHQFYLKKQTDREKSLAVV